MKVVYPPKGKAQEYADLALNIYKGCTHGCKYCYNARLPWAHNYFEAANPKTDLISKLRHDCDKLAKRNDVPEILISFVGDPYQPAEKDLRLTRQAIEILIDHDLPFTILTKGGLRATRDFDLLEGRDNVWFGTSLSFWDQPWADTWEPYAAPIIERIIAITDAHMRGIPTWVSIEPVIDPTQALRIIDELSGWVDRWRIGKINHFPKIEKEIDWIKFRTDVTRLLESWGADYYLKKSLTEL